MMKKFIIPLSLVMSIFASGCNHKTTAEPTETVISQGSQFRGGVIGYRDSKPLNAVAMATAFRMSGDYANNVAITIASNGQPTYFPAPTDISPNSAPVDLGNGWWLNRQGIGPASSFTKYTFEQYAALKKVPSIAELKKAVIPGAKVTEFRELPFTISEAMQNLDSIKSYLCNPDNGSRKLYLHR